MFSPIEATIPGATHIKVFQKEVNKNLSAIYNLQKELNAYFTKCIFSLSRTASSDLLPIYDDFIKSGTCYAAAFGSFAQKIEPIINQAKSLEEKHTLMKKSFQEYLDSIKIVRKEESEEKVAEEEKKLLDFVTKFTEFNNDSNSLCSCFLMLYSACETQLSYDTAKFLKELGKQIEKMQPFNKLTEEEVELDKTIEELEKELKENEEKQNTEAANEEKKSEEEKVEIEEKTTEENAEKGKNEEISSV